MKYMCLIYENEAMLAEQSEAEQEATMGEYMAFTQRIQAAGAMDEGAPLLPTNTATTVRVRDGKATHTDGPFAETKEQLGGYYLIDCKDLDEALDYAARIPSARYGCVEVRPVMVFDEG